MRIWFVPLLLLSKSWCCQALWTGLLNLVYGLTSQHSIHVFLVVPTVSHQPSWASPGDVLGMQTALLWEKLRFPLSLCHKHTTQESIPRPAALRVVTWNNWLERNRTHWILIIYHLCRHRHIPCYIPHIPLKIILRSALVFLFGDIECCLSTCFCKKRLHLYGQLFFQDITKSPVLSLWDENSWINKNNTGFWPLFAKEEKNVLYYVA